MIRKIFKLIIICGILGLVVYTVSTGGEFFKNLSVFTVKTVEVNGIINSDRKAVSALGSKFIGMNIFDESINEGIVSNDPWVQKIIARRVLPNKINLIVYEEKALFSFKGKNNKCYIFTGSGRNMASSCDNVNISVDKDLDIENGMKFAAILEKFPFLKGDKIVLKEYSFEVYSEDEILRCPYDSSLFEKNYNLYITTLKSRYSSIEYADLTISKRIYIKGVQNASQG